MSHTANELTVAGRLDNLAIIGRFVTHAAAQAGLGERDIYAVQMAVDEACTNIIQHAYGGEERGDIHLICHTQEDGLRIIIYDWGQVTFNPDRVPDLDTSTSLEKRQPGGMGLFFVQNLMDHVEFNFNTPRGNQLILFKQREQTL